jgi:hypothetical protein
MDRAQLLRRLFPPACLLITLCTTFSVRTVQGQYSAAFATAAEGQLPEPANADNHVYYADRQRGTLLPLERQTQNVYTSKRFFAGSAGTVVSGARSSFRINSGQPQEFVTRFSPNMGIDRSSVPTISHYVVLIPLTSKKNRREFEMANWRQNFLSGEFEYEIKPPVSEREIPVEVKPYGDGSALIKPVTLLPPGEYAFWAACAEGCNRKDPQDRCEFFYSFGVDLHQ